MKSIFSFIFFIASTCSLIGTIHPGLMLTSDGVKAIRASLGKYPAFDKAFYELKNSADKALTKQIVVPVPKDAGGGYTHEKHKSNYYEMNAAGMMYQLTGESKYANFVRNMLMEYAKLYPALGLHPAGGTDTPGKLFWQALNDCVWLVNVANAYDCVYNYMNETDRAFIEQHLFYPMADFISNGNPANYAVFNKMHNHGTWAIAAVGMIGYAMGNKDLVEKALYGSKKDGQTGFIKQLDMLFSPDGYYTEGPYYQRYALSPFMTFAQAIQNQQPELTIFQFRDSILLKAVNALIQCAYNGKLFELNDALPKTYQTPEIISAIDIAYSINHNDRELLDIARQQNDFIVSNAGLTTAKAMYTEKIPSLKLHSCLLRDGAKGDEGGISILRTGQGDKQTCLVLKATSHGLSHGHYDKLALAFYDNGHEIVSDYGAARFLNIEPKSGGNYTKENRTYATQTIAHNTVTVNEKSHFNASIKLSSQHHSDIQFCDLSNPALQVFSAVERNAYSNVSLQRTTALLNDSTVFQYPIIIDIFRVNSTEALRTIDLPFYYKGHLVSTNFNYKKSTDMLKPLGVANGYQHLWVEATGSTNNLTACFTWVNDNRFYSITTIADTATQFFMTRLGANDPSFNLRNEPCFMVRQPDTQHRTFASIIEPHGNYDLVKEVTDGYQSTVGQLQLVYDKEDFTALKITTTGGKSFLFVGVNSDFDATKKRSLLLNGETISFTGNYYLQKYKK